MKFYNFIENGQIRLGIARDEIAVTIESIGTLHNTLR